MVHVDTDLEFESPKGDGWWDVPVAEVSTLGFTQDARVRYEKFKADQRPYLSPQPQPGRK
jgi:3D-(3,5/4)-trihydroxycyclohexane-1,2-dione acylhydrolase (decyclizing)